MRALRALRGPPRHWSTLTSTLEKSRSFATYPTILGNFSQQTMGVIRDFTGPDPKVGALEKALKEERHMVQQLKERLQKMEELEMQRIDDAKKIKEANTHPILGEMVADLGYKKIYRASLQSLTHIPMWEKQRAYRDDRAKKIAKDKKDSVVKGGFPGTLVAYQFAQTGALGLLDGQHRLGAQIHMARAGLCDANSQDVLVEVFEFNDGKKADRLFIEINKAEPVKAIDMPGEVQPNVKAAIDEAVDELKGKYSDMFKVSSNCLAPHVNIDVLRSDIFEADVCGRFQLKTKDSVLKWIESRNNEMINLDDEAWIARRGKSTA